VAAQNPEAAQDPTFWDNITQGWEGMDPGSKALMVIGGGLGLLGLVNAMSGEGGIGDWLLAALGLGGAAAMAGNAGMMGPEAQQMLGGFGQQISGMLPGFMGGNQTPAAAPTKPQAPPAGQNPNIPPAPDFGNVVQDNDWLQQYVSGGTDPNTLDAGDATQIVTDWATGKLPSPQVDKMIAGMSPEQRNYISSQIDAKLPTLGRMEGMVVNRFKSKLQRQQ
jgi:hypothetical protein